MHKHASIFITSLALGLAIPITTSALYTRHMVGVHNGPDAVNEIRFNRNRLRQDLGEARRIYSGLKANGATDIPEPDINKYDTTVKPYLDAVPAGDVKVDQYFKGSPVSDKPLSTTDYAVPTEETLPTEITDGERRSLRQSIRTGKCWRSLDKFSPGFRALCKSLTEGKDESRFLGGNKSDLIRLRDNDPSK